MTQYSLGFDFGSLSVRGLLVNIQTGEQVQSAEWKYRHGIFSDHLPDGTKLPPQFALQDPQDYLEGIQQCSKELLKRSGIDAREVVAIGLDSTASTIIPVDAAGRPLCEYEEFRSNPHAWLKLWKHHGAVAQSESFAEAARQSNPQWFQKCGGIISSEWFLPKAFEIAEQAPQVYERADSILEVIDWIANILTDAHHRSEAIAACNCCYSREFEYPSNNLVRQAFPVADQMFKEKFREDRIMLGEKTGNLSAHGAALLGLQKGTTVAVPTVDSHACVCGTGACLPGDLTYICGTSAVEILLSDSEVSIPGVHINARDASIPGLFSLGVGQSCVGDVFSWFVSNCVPPDYFKDAKIANVDIFSFLGEKAKALGAGKSGLIALDWWNGVRTPFFRFDLSGALFGLSIRTRPEHIWLALLESHAFNVRKSIDRLTSNGHPVNRIFATGGIPRKNPVLIQILADVLQKEIHICKGEQLAALGSAIMGAAAIGKDDFRTVHERMHSKTDKTFYPNEQNKEIYNKLFTAYDELSDRFGTDAQLQRLLKL